MRKPPEVSWEEHFWNRVLKTGDCWYWTGGTFNTGYGQVWFPDPTTHRCSPQRANRVAYWISKGPFDEGLDVLHTCDHILCVNPEHLFLGTAKDNCQDAVLKGRWTHGERNHFAKLTEAQVIQIFNQCKTRAMKDLALEYGVAYETIWCIYTGHSWRHLGLWKIAD